jgi:hypothetical protein
MVNLLRRLRAWWTRDERAIQDWERRTGRRWIREGHVKKGGRNGPPRGERPPAPRF